jgi:hypothetical protein
MSDFDASILPKMKYFAAIAMASVIKFGFIYIGKKKIKSK